MTKKNTSSNEIAKGEKVKSENTFTKEQILASSKLEYSKDLISTLLSDNETYTLKEVEAKINNFMKRKVK